ncbi:hypothetical protein BU116_01260 [Staphylococcus xylosus]|uniref:hypothetical protein n=1 Tax=Staphylococcus TaxID=1279 RepID=UPI000E6908FA|nr:hypothetical protein [Staphylococcus xylosus]RIM80109.1 hypothetical protein BU116_01260 [Staphylococcus xylosus]
MSKKRYEVLHKFIDLEDKNKVYNVGDTYPKPVNKKVSHDRLLDLTTSDNKRGKVLIKEIEK